MRKFYRSLIAKSTYTQSRSRIHSSNCETDVCLTEAAQIKIIKSHRTRRNSCKAIKRRNPRSSQTDYIAFSTGDIPQEWKEAEVTPIFKSGEKDDVNNYRPTSVLSLISKVMAVQLVSFLTENNVSSEHQSGFRKRQSTQTAVTHLSDFILDLMDKQKLTRAVFINL